MGLYHSIILVKRKTVEDLLGFMIEPISPSVNRLLKQRLLEGEQEERLRTYILYERAQNSRIVLGILSETLAQT